MTVDALFATLARVEVVADLDLVTGDGEKVRFRTDPARTLTVDCGSHAALWDLFRLARRFRGKLSVSTLRRLRSPFVQDLLVRVDGRPLFRWRPDRLPKVLSLGHFLGWLRARQD